MSLHASPRHGYITPPFDHPTAPYPSTESFSPFTFTSLPQRTTSISASSIPLSPSRKAPPPPRRVPKSRLRNLKRLHMQMVEPEQIGLWTLVEDTEGEASATSINDPTYLWGDHRPQSSVTHGVKSMTAIIDVTQWRATTNAGVGLGIQTLPAVGEENNGPREVYDGLFYVPPMKTGGSGFRLWQRDEVDSPTSSESSFGTLDFPPSPTEPTTPHTDTKRASGRAPPPPLTFSMWNDQQGPLVDRLPLLLQSPFTPRSPKPVPLAESPAREGRLLSSPRSIRNAFETPSPPTTAPETTCSLVSSTSASSIASTCSSTSDGPATPRTPTHAHLGSFPMERELALGDGKRHSLVLERFLCLAEDEDEWYIPSQGFPLPPPSCPLPATPEPNALSRRSPPCAPTKPSADRREGRGGATGSCRALQGVMGFLDPEEDTNARRRSSYPEDAVRSPTPSGPRRSSEDASSPVMFEFILDMSSPSAPRREQKLVLSPMQDARPVKGAGLEKRRRELPVRKGLPLDWLAPVKV